MSRRGIVTSDAARQIPTIDLLDAPMDCLDDLVACGLVAFDYVPEGPELLSLRRV
jgi:hypothetical protein